MPGVTIPQMRDHTTIARVIAQDNGGAITLLDDGAIAVRASRRLFLSRRGIESALGYPMRHSVWRNLRERVEDGTVSIADDMTLLIEREPRVDTPSTPASPGVYVTQRYRSSARNGSSNPIK